MGEGLVVMVVGGGVEGKVNSQVGDECCSAPAISFRPGAPHDSTHDKIIHNYYLQLTEGWK